jgi:CHAT domain-containing protein
MGEAPRLNSSAKRLVVAGLCLMAMSTPRVAAQEDASQVVRRAVARMEEYAEYFRQTGDLNERAPMLQEVLADLDRACPALAAAGDRAGAAACFVKAGDAARMLSQRFMTGDLPDADQRSVETMMGEALRRCREGERLARAAGASQALADALIGTVRTQLGPRALHDYRAAAAAIDEAISLSAALPDRSTLANALLQKSVLDTEQGDLPAAVDEVNRVVAIQQKRGDETGRFYALLNRASNYLDMARWCDFQLTFAECDENANRARADYEAIRAIAAAHGWTGLAKMANQFIADVALRRTLIAGRKNAQETNARLFHPKVAGDVFVSQQFVSSGELPPELLQLLKRMGGLPSLNDAREMYLKGMDADARGDTDAAIKAFLKAVSILETDRRQTSDSEARGRFLESRIDFYYPPMLHLLQRGEFAEAFRLVEASRSRVLADLVATRQQIGDARQRQLLARDQELRTLIARSQKMLFDARTRADYDAAETTAAEQRLERLQRERAGILAEIRRVAPALLEPTVAELTSLADVLRAADAGRYDVLEYVALDHAVIVWHIGSGAVHVRDVFLPRGELAAKVDRLRESVAKGKDVPFDAATARELFLFLFEPMKPFIKSGHLVIIPHEELHYAPFHAFQDPADGRYLGQMYRISYAPSATVLNRLKTGGNLAGSAILALAGPNLPQAPLEVQSIGRFFPPERVTKLLNASATKDELKRRAGGADVLHLAAHAYFDPIEPLLSYIQLAPSSSSDGHLLAAEMYGFQLARARLVTLSACQTGNATATHGGDVIGMQRALIYAGAGALLLTQWEVDSEATALWMETFYREAVRAPLPDAAQSATNALLASTKYQHPFFWAPFFVVGR